MNVPASEDAFVNGLQEHTLQLKDAMTAQGASSLSSFSGVVLMAYLLGRNLTPPPKRDRTRRQRFSEPLLETTPCSRCAAKRHPSQSTKGPQTTNWFSRLQRRPLQHVHTYLDNMPASSGYTQVAEISSVRRHVKRKPAALRSCGDGDHKHHEDHSPLNLTTARLPVRQTYSSTNEFFLR